MNFGVCCIVLGLEDQKPPVKFNKMTYSNFSKLERNKAIEILGARILNNIKTTFCAIKFCHSKGYCYRLSSDLFPLITYDKANISLENLPCFDEIESSFNEIKNFLCENKIRISLHPSEYNTLASLNEEAVKKTIKELNFYSRFMDRIGCPASFESPMNLHINNNIGRPEDIIERLSKSIDQLDTNCQKRLVIENDDKSACWSVRKLNEYYFKKLKRPITFDFLHHKCHPDGLSEKEAINICYETWGDVKPLFHFSESRSEDKIRAHADYPSFLPETYGLNFDLDFEFKMKEKAIRLCEENFLRKELICT
jgi:UV DNA damage endonuclease